MPSTHLYRSAHAGRGTTSPRKTKSATAAKSFGKAVGPSRTAESIDLLLEIVAKQTKDWGYPKDDQNLPWYRGHASLGWKLCPSSLRGRPWGKGTCSDENESIEEFLTKAPALGLHSTTPLSLWNGYFLMQHHCVPTRLLDWTESVLVAAYFAVAADPIDNDSCIWMLDPYELNKGNPDFGKNAAVSPGFVGNRKSEEKKIDRWLPVSNGRSFDSVPKMPLAVYPAYFSRRIESQRAAFTVHGSDKEGLARAWRRGLLLRIIIPGQNAGRLRTTLRDMGINRATVYPDVEGLGRHLAERWGPAAKKQPHRDVYVRLKPSKIHLGGVGVFAIRPIPKGTNVFSGECEKIVWTDERDLPKERNLKRLYTDFGVLRSGRYGTPETFNSIGPGWYLNSSKKPNVFCDENFDFIALRDISSGEELTADYDTYSDSPGTH